MLFLKYDIIPITHLYNLRLVMSYRKEKELKYALKHVMLTAHKPEHNTCEAGSWNIPSTRLGSSVDMLKPQLHRLLKALIKK